MLVYISVGDCVCVCI